MTTVTSFVDSTARTQFDAFSAFLDRSDVASLRATLRAEFDAFGNASDLGSYVEESLTATRYVLQVRNTTGTTVGRITYTGTNFNTAATDSDVPPDGLRDNVILYNTTLSQIKFSNATGVDLMVLNTNVSLSGGTATSDPTGGSFRVNSLQLGSVALGAQVILTASASSPLGVTVTNSGANATLNGSLNGLTVLAREGDHAYEISVTGTFTPNASFVSDTMTGGMIETLNSLTGTVSAVRVRRINYTSSTNFTPLATQPADVLNLSGLNMDTAGLNRLMAAVEGSWEDTTFGYSAGNLNIGNDLELYSGTQTLLSSQMQRLDSGKIVFAGIYGPSNHPGITTGGDHILRVFRFNADGTRDTTFSGDGYHEMQLTTPDDTHRYSLQRINSTTGDVFIRQMYGSTSSSTTTTTVTRIAGAGGAVNMFTLDTPVAMSSVTASSLRQWNSGPVFVAVVSGASGTNQTLSVVKTTAAGVVDANFGGSFGTTGVALVSLDASAINRIFTIGYSDNTGRTLAVLGDTGSSDASSPRPPAFTLVRLTSTGALDTSFSGDGKYTFTAPAGTPPVSQIDARVLSDGDILVMVTAPGGSIYDSQTQQFTQPYPPSVTLFRYNSDGSADTSFGTDGMIAYPIGAPGTYNAPLYRFEADGRFLVASGATQYDQNSNAHTSQIEVRRFLANGAPDTSFGGDGSVSISLGNTFTGYFNVGYNYDSYLGRSWFGGAMASQPDGSVILNPAAYNEGGMIVRFLADGTARVEPGSGINAAFADYVVDPSTGNLIVAPTWFEEDYSSTMYSQTYVTELVRLTQPETVETALGATAFGGADTITLSGSEDRSINGYAGNDIITTGSGNDELNGGLGNDTLTSGDGLDRYVFDTAPGSANIDTLADFDRTKDVLVLSRAIFGAIAFGTDGSLPAGALSTTGTATGADTRIIYNPTTGALSYDADGTGTVAAQQFATLGTTAANRPTTLTTANFGSETALRVASVPGTFTISTASQRVTEGNTGSTPAVYTITRTSASDVVSTARWDLGFSNWGQHATTDDIASGQITGGNIVFGLGETSKTLTVNLAADTAVERNEWLRVTVRDASATQTAATAYTTIVDDDDRHPAAATATVGMLGNGLFGADINATGDQDAFVLNLVAGKTYQFYTAASSSAATQPTPAPRILNSSGAAVTTGVTHAVTGNLSVLSFAPTTSGTYYFSEEFAGGATGSYMVVSSEVGLDDFGNSAATALVNYDPYGYVSNGVGGVLAAGDDVDWMTVSFEAGRTYSFSLTALATSGASLTLKSADGQTEIPVTGATTASSSFAGMQTMSWSYTAQTAGTYRLQIDSTAATPWSLNAHPDNHLNPHYRDTTGNPLAPVIRISARTAAVGEGHSGTTPMLFRVTRDGNTDAASTVNWSVVAPPVSVDHPGMANANDFVGGTLPAGTITFSAGSSVTYLTVNIGGDTLPEGDEMFTVTLTDPTNGVLDSNYTAAYMNIATDDSGFTASLTQETFAENEPVILQIDRIGSASTVTWAIESVGTSPAVAADFSGSMGGTVSFAPEQTRLFVTITPTADGVQEGAETFQVRLSNPGVGNTVSGPVTRTLGDAVITNDLANNFGDTSRPYGTLTNGRADSRIDLLGDADWFQFAVTTPGTYVLQALGAAGQTGSGRLSDPTLTLYDANGNQIAYNDDTTTLNSRIERILAAGTYYAAVRAYGSYSTGDYTLTVDGDATAIPPAVARIEAMSPSQSEGNAGAVAPFIFRVTRDRAELAGTVGWSLSNGDTVMGDFNAGQPLGGTLSFAQNQTVALLTVSVGGDNTFETNESFSVVLSNGDQIIAATDSAQRSATAMIVNDDAQPSFNFSFAGSSSVVEGQNLVLNFSRSGNLDQATSVSYLVEGLTQAGSVSADPMADFYGPGVSFAPQGLVSFAAGETLRSITIATFDDSAIESSETFGVRMNVLEGAVALGGPVRVGELRDNDSVSYYGITGGSRYAEGSSAVFTVTRSGLSSAAAVVDWAVESTGASPATANDFSFGILAATVFPSGRLTFAAGQTTALVTLAIRADATAEVDETFAVRLTGLPSGALLSGSGRVEAAITGSASGSDDFASSFGDPIAPYGVITIGAERTGTIERAGDADWFQFSVTTAGVHTIEVRGAAEGAAAALSDPTLTIYDATGAQIAYNDDWNSLNSHIERTLNSGTYYAAVRGYGNYYAGRYEISVESDSAVVPTASIQALSQRQAEGSNGATTAFVFQVNRSEDDTAGTINWSVGGAGANAATADDFVAEIATIMPSGVLSFGAGQSTALLTIAVRADYVVEADQGFAVTLTNGSGINADPLQSSAFTVIANDDQPAGYSFSLSSGGEVVEGGNMVITFNRTGDLSQASSASFSVVDALNTPRTENADFYGTGVSFAPQGLVSFAVGESTRTVTIATYDDSTSEGTEHFAVRMNVPTGSAAPANQQGRIIDNDSTATYFSISLPASSTGRVSEGDKVVFNVSRAGTAAATIGWVMDPAGLAPATGNDFGAGSNSVLPSGTISFAAGVTTVAVTIDVFADALPEGDEGFAIRLTNVPTSAQISGSGVVSGVIAGSGITDDYADSLQDTESAFGNLSMLAAASGQIEVAGDADWFRVVVSESGSYTFDAVGNPTGQSSAANLSDPTLTLYNASGAQIAYNDDSSGSLNSHVVTQLGAGTYYAAVRAFANTGRGAYTLRMQSEAAQTSFARITALAPQSAEGQSGTTPVVFQINRSDASNAASVNWSLAGSGTHAAIVSGTGSDLASGAAGTATFTQGQYLAFVTVQVQGDTAVEEDERFTVTLNEGVGVTIDQNQRAASAVIVNDDAEIDVDVLPVNGSVTGVIERSQERDEFTLNITAAGTYILDLVGDGATPLRDTYLYLYDSEDALLASNDDWNGSLNAHLERNLAVGQYTVVAAGYSSNTGTYRLSARTPAQSTQSEISIQAATPLLSEGNSGNTAFVFNVVRSGNTSGSTALTWTLNPGQATAADFAANQTAGSLTFTAGQTQRQITIQVLGDAAPENDEAFSLTLNTTATNTVLLNPTAYATIRNDDARPLVYATASATSVREGGNVVFTVNRSGNTGVASNVTWTLEGAGGGAAGFSSGDLSSAMSGILSFAAGSTTAQQVTVRVATDSLTEYDENFRFVLASANATVSEQSGALTVEIEDGSVSDYSISTTQSGRAEGNSASTSFAYTITRTGNLGAAAVDWSVVPQAGGATADDFTANSSSGTVSFSAGQTQSQITIQVRGDTTVELDEAFEVVLSVPHGATSGADRAQGMIINDDTSGASTNDDNSRARANNLGVLGAGGASSASSADFVGTADREDYYKFTLNAGGDVHIRLTGLSADADVELQDANGNRIASSTWGGSHDDAIDRNNLAAGDYYVRVYQYSGDTAYRLNVAAGAVQLGTVAFAADSLSRQVIEGASGATAVVFTANRTGNTEGPATVDYAVGSFTPTLDASDFSGASALPTGTLTFAAGASTATITLQVAGDTAIETDEYYSVTLSNATGAVIDLSRATAQGAIRNDDIPQDELPTIGIQARESNRAEGETGVTPFVFALTREGALSGASAVGWSIVHGTTDADDFSGGLSGTVSFAAGEASRLLTINVAGDTRAEADELFSVALGNTSGALVDPRAMTAAGTIRNDDIPSTFIIDPLFTTAHEGNDGVTDMVFNVRRVGDTSGAASVAWRRDNLTTVDADFASGATTGTLSFGAGVSSQTITIAVAGDTTVEQNERFVVRLENATGGRIDAVNGIATGQIENDDAQNLFAIEAAAAAFQSEGNSGTTDLVFTLTSSTGGGTVGWRVRGFAPSLDGEDFVGGALPSGTYSFAAGETSAQLTIQVAGDLVAESDEMFAVELHTPTAGQLSPRSMAVAAIFDDDSYGDDFDESVQLSVMNVVAATASRAEGNAGTTDFVFNVSRSGGLGQSAAVDWVVRGESGGLTVADFAADDEGGYPSGTLNFGAEDSTLTLTVRVRGDTVQELNEAFSLEISSEDANVVIADNGGEARALILNDDAPPSVSITALDADKDEGNPVVHGLVPPTNYTFRVNRTGATTGSTTVNWAVTGGTAAADDFFGAFTGNQRPGGSVTFAAGETSRDITVAVRGDAVAEFDEVFFVSLSNLQGGVFVPGGRTATGQIRTDDVLGATAARVSIEATDAVKAEGTGSTPTDYVFTVRRSGNLYPTLPTTASWAVVSGGAVSANDFATGTTTFSAASSLPSGTVTFAAGAETAMVTLRVMGDAAAEADEVFSVRLNSATNGDIVASARTAQGVIQNDDRLTNVRLERVDASGSVVSDMIVTEGSGAATPVRLRISRDQTAASGSVGWSVDLSGTQSMASAADFTGSTSGTVSFAANEFAKTITLTLAADTTVETSENFAVRLATAPGVTFADGGQRLAMSIRDDDDDYGSSTTASGSLSVLGTATGGIMPSGDQDWFRVSLAANTRYEFAMGSPEFAPVLRLMDGNGTQIADNVQDGTGTDTRDGLAILSYTTGTTAGTYFISAEAANGGVGRYALHANAADRDDYASAATGAGSINATTGALSVGRIETSGDSDWFAVRLTSGSNYRIGALATDGMNGGRVRIVDATGSMLASGEIANGTANFIYRAGTTATAYVSVDGGSGTGLYAVGANQLSSTDVTLLPSISVTPTPTSVVQEGHSGSTALTFNVIRTGNLQNASTVGWSLSYPSGDGAAAATDFTGATTGTVSFAAGSANATITVLARGDAAVEGDETFTVNLNSTTNGILDVRSANGLIRNDDAYPEVSIRTLTASQSEGSTTATANPPRTAFVFEVSRSGSTALASTVAWTVGSYDSNFTAADYAVGSGVVSFATGETSKLLTVNVVQDRIEENDESFYVRLATPTNAVLNVNQAVATVVNDDFTPHLSIQAQDALRAEGDAGTTPFVFTVLRTGNLAEGDVAVDWAVTGSGSAQANADDFIGGLPRGAITFAANESERQITLNVAGDFIFEADESFTVTLSNARNTARTAVIDLTSATGTIRNDDRQTVSLAPTVASITEGGNQIFTVTRSSNIGSLVVGVDTTYGSGASSADLTTGAPANITFAAGNTSASFTVRVADDTESEGNETFALTLGSGEGYTVDASAGASNILIVDNDRSTVSVSSARSLTVTEGSTTATTNPPRTNVVLTLSRTGATTNPLVVNWGTSGDAANTSDLVATSGTATFAARSSTTTVTVQVVQDRTVENNESFTFAIGDGGTTYNASTVAGTASVMISNDDTATSTRPDYAGDTRETAYAIGQLTSARPFNGVSGESVGFNLPGSDSVDRNDWYRFTLTNRGTVTVNLTGLSADADLQLVNSSGTVIGGSYAAGSSSDRITSGMLESGDYYIRVYQYAGQTAYTLSATTTGAPDGAGNSTTAARNIGTLTATPQTFADSVSGGDPDYYRFATTGSSNFRLSLSGLSDNADVHLLDASGNTLRSSANAGSAAESISVDGLAAGTYYVWVAPMVSTATALTSYSLTLSAEVAAAADTGYNTLALADAATVNSAFPVNGFVGSTDRNDYYRYAITTQANLTINLTGLSADADLQLLNGSGTVLGGSYAAGSASDSVTVNNLAAGEYFVRVYQYAGNTNYNLAVTQTAVALPTDTDGTVATASAAQDLTTTPRVIRNTVGFAAQATGTGDTDGIDARDYYRFSLAVNHRVEISLADLAADADVRVYRAGTTANTLGDLVIPTAYTTPIENPNGTTSVVFTTNTALTAGTYYVEVSSAASVGTGYTLGMRRLPADDTGYDTLTLAQAATVNSTFPVAGFVGSSDRNDYYRITSAGVATMTVSLTGMTSDADVQVLNSSGTVIGGSYAAGSANDTITLSNVQAGNYYVRVYQYAGDTNYSLAVTQTGVLATDTDATQATATRIGTGNLAGNTTTTVTGNIGRAARPVGTSDTDGIDAADFHYFTLAANSRVEVSLTGMTADADVLLYRDANNDGDFDDNVDERILPPAGTSNPVGAVPEVFFTSESLAAGTTASPNRYYVRVTGAATDYSLSVRTVVADDYANTTSTTGQLGTAGTAPGATAVTRTGNIESIGDTDWFAVTLTAGTAYTIRQLRSTTGTAQTLSDSFIRGIYDSTGTLIANTQNDDSEGTLNSLVIFNPTATGTYYIAAGAYGSSTGTYTVSVQQRSTNVAPTVTNPITNQVATEGQAFSYRMPWNVFTDPEGQTLSFAATQRDGSALPTWLTFDAASQMFSGTAPTGTADVAVRVRATDTGGLTADSTFTITTPASADDFLANIRTTGRVTAGGNVRGNIETVQDQDWFRVTLAANTSYVINLNNAGGTTGLSDPYLRGLFDSAGTAIANTSNDDSGGTLNSQVSFTTTAAGDFYIAAGAYGENRGAYTLSVSSGSTTAGQSGQTTTTGNHAPTVSAGVADQSAYEGQAWSFTVPSGAFADSDTGTNGQLTYSARLANGNALPGWLTFNAATRTFSGTPTAGAEDVSIAVTARDGGGLTASDAFLLRTPTAQTNVGGTGSANWTIMVYLAADNNLDSYALKDLNEMESVTLPSGVNVVFMLDRLGNNNTFRGQVRPDTNTNAIGSYTSITEVNSGDPATLTGFINWAASNYTAQNYGLVIWDHGGGLSGTSWDDTSNHANLSIAETTTAIRNSALGASGFDMIGFDTCLQGMVEQAYDLHTVTDYVVASQDLEPGDGWDYAAWLRSLSANPNSTAAQVSTAAVTAYGNFYQHQETLAAVDTGRLTAAATDGLTGLRDAINAFVDATGSATSTQWTALRNARTGVTNYNNANYLDLGAYMGNVATATAGSAIATSAQAVTTALNAAVISTTAVGGAGSAGQDDSGLSIFLPSSGAGSSYSASQYQFVADSRWGSFLSNLASHA